jgi:DNA-binding LytR/AlgR family response regulator
LFFSAADKYVRVVTAEREYLIRTPIKTLLPQLDPKVFWQIHRSTVVQAQAIASVSRDAQGKIWLRLKQHPEPLVVSRLHTDLFKAM